MLVAQHTLNGRTLVVWVATPKASSVPSLKEFLLYMYYPLVDTSCIMFQIFGFSLFPLSCDIIFYRGKKWDSNFMLGPCEYLVELQIIVNYVAWSLWPSVKTYIYVDEVLPNVFTFNMLMLYLWEALEFLSNMVILVEEHK